MSSPSRFNSGVSTRPFQSFGGGLPFPDPQLTSRVTGLPVVHYENDFLDLGSAVSRTITGASSTFSLVDGSVGGIGVLTPGAATTASSIYRTAAAWQFISGQRLWCRHRIAFSGVTGVTGYAGLIKQGAATTDSLLFKMASGGVVSLVSAVNSVNTTLVSNVVTMTPGTMVDLAYYYNGVDLLVYVNDVLKARVQNVTIGASGTTLTNAKLTPILQITPAASETVSIDHALIAQEMVR